MPDKFHIERGDGSHWECECGEVVFEMVQDKMPHCAVVRCVGCAALYLGAAPSVKENAIWN